MRSSNGFSGYGNVVLIDMGDGLQALYAHLARVAVRVGEQIFAAAIHSQETEYPLDFRLALDTTGVRMSAVELPSGVEDALRRLLKAAGLRYGAIDMRMTPDGDYVFLEINPAGQWRFVEEVTGQPITDAMAVMLTDLDAYNKPREKPDCGTC